MKEKKESKQQDPKEFLELQRAIEQWRAYFKSVEATYTPRVLSFQRGQKAPSRYSD